MADESSKITLEAEIKSTTDPKGFQEAQAELGKLGDKADKATGEASELQQRLNKLTAQADKLAAAGGRGAGKMVALKVELDKLEKEAKEAGVAVTGLSAAYGKLDRAKANIAAIRVENFKLKDELGGVVAKQTFQQQLFNDAAGSMGQYAQAIGVVGAALAGGFTIGMALGKKAGIDYTETQDLANEATKNLAKGIAWLTTGPYVWLIEKMQAAGRETDNLFAPIERVNEELRRHQREAERGSKQLDKFAEATKKLGIVTKKDATAAAVEWTKSLRAMVGQEAISVKEKDKLITRYRELKGQGAEFSAEQLRLIAQFELETKTTTEAAAAKEKLATETKRLTDEQTKLADEQERAQEKGDKALAAAVSGGRTFQQFGENVVKHWQKMASEAVLAAETEIRLFGPDSERLQDLKAASLAEIELAKTTTEEKRAARLDLFEKIAKIELDALKLQKGADSEAVASYRKRVADILAAAQIGADAKLDLATQSEEDVKELTDAEVKWEAMGAEEKVNTAIGAVGQMAALGQQAFGESKELAMAQALVNTYSAAEAAFAAMSGIPPAPVWGVAAAALAVVAGLKNVDAIRKQKKKKAPAASTGSSKAAPSFDDPVNDAAARMAGRASARDVVNHHGRAFVSELRSGFAQRRAGNTAPATIAAGGGGGSTLVVNGDVIGVPKAEFWKSAVRSLAAMDKSVEVRVRGNRSARVK